jgi:biopolymer transport protein ExbB
MAKLCLRIGLVVALFAMSTVPHPPAPAWAQASPAASESTAPSTPSSSPGVLPNERQSPAPRVPHDLSPWSMFMGADLVVKAVMVGLAFASLVTWTIFVGKLIELWIARRRVNASLRTIARARSLSDAAAALTSDRSVTRAFVSGAINEARLSSDILNEAGIKERVASVFGEITRAEARRIRLGMGMLATIGATSPFVGLFGTVWGIMNSFIGISKSQTTNLAVVAPGIAEALLATAIGLVAAIPAVIIYNHYARVTKGYLELVNRAAGAVGRQLSRDLERPHAKPLRQQAAE